MASSDQTRLLLVEDVPQVAQYIRGLLNSQTSVKLLDVMTDGSKVIPQIQQLRPDVILIDSLLQGKVKGLQLVEQIHEANLNVPVIVLTVPQNPVAQDAEAGIHGVLSMPFSGFDLLTRINMVRREFETVSTTGASSTRGACGEYDECKAGNPAAESSYTIDTRTGGSVSLHAGTL
jgi:DNA-binding NarL/FixJ family response regulator